MRIGSSRVGGRVGLLVLLVSFAACGTEEQPPAGPDGGSPALAAALAALCTDPSGPTDAPPLIVVGDSWAAGLAQGLELLHGGSRRFCNLGNGGTTARQWARNDDLFGRGVGVLDLAAGAVQGAAGAGGPDLPRRQREGVEHVDFWGLLQGRTPGDPDLDAWGDRANFQDCIHPNKGKGGPRILEHLASVGVPSP